MTLAIDWPQLLADLAHVLGEPDFAFPEVRVPCGRRILARELGVPDGTLRNWIEGGEPKHSSGEMLLDRWCELTGKGRVFAPRARRSLTAAER